VHGDGDDRDAVEVRRAADPETAEWVAALTATGPAHEAAVARLHALMLRVAHAEASRRSGMNGIHGRELEDLAQQAAGDAVVSILRKVDEFRGDSRFTTWAYKFVVYEVSNKVGRHVWRRERVRLDEDAWSRLPERLGSGPAAAAECRQLVEAVHEAVEKVLTPHQQRVFRAIVLDAMPLDALVAELGSNRNAVYKTLFDARRKLRAFLVTHGYLPSSLVND